MKNKKYYAFKILHILVYVVFIIPYSLHLILYYTSKLIRALSYLLIFKTASAKEEISDFWTVYSSVGDI